MNQTSVVDASPVCVIDSVPAIGEISESTPIPNGGPAEKEPYDITMTVDPLIECDSYDIGDLSSEDSKNILRRYCKWILCSQTLHMLIEMRVLLGGGGDP